MEKRMKRKGQITAFIIVGILILLLASFAYLFWSAAMAGREQETAAVEIGQAASSIQTYVQACLQDVAEDAVLHVARYGGYYEPPADTDPALLLPVYFDHGVRSDISREELQHQLARYIEDNLFFCVKTFVPFREQGILIQQGEEIATAVLQDDTVVVSLQYPLRLRSGGAETSLASFSARVPARLSAIHNAISEFFAVQEEDPSSICISCLAQLNEQYTLRTEMNPLNEDGLLLYTITDDQVLVHNLPLKYRFLARYSFPDQPGASPSETAPPVTELPEE
ncbi:hypothetical protein HYU19_02580 [Candidatus Woesearchaeota archaeon]|nr:hypothetical protein [Candidatus Woesearchaeota archaeon]